MDTHFSNRTVLIYRSFLEDTHFFEISLQSKSFSLEFDVNNSDSKTQMDQQE